MMIGREAAIAKQEKCLRYRTCSLLSAIIFALDTAINKVLSIYIIGSPALDYLVLVTRF